MSKRSVRYLLYDMLDAIEAIRSFIDGYSFEQFVDDRKTHDAVIRNVQVLGEAANRVPVDFRETHPQIEWLKIIRSRHILVHDYFGVDYEIVWRIVITHLPPLQLAIEAIFTNEFPDDLENEPA
ncbi:MULTISPECIES: HepT-like ribonuclease domain-containing protein [Spirosoma]|uniref:DUF86 domain-containing protein n=1 Tax=Spirosoma sordidisoli TaxID=2502893 RepID=A0A4Q2UJG5_9BACT|nr:MULTISPECIES: DUF86 domain-containing protein [Spirosoma]RYC68752.1 DUF86 domain-containing protein [Spirosoma sordidisoli]